MLGTVPLPVASGNTEWKVISAGGYSPAGATLARIVLAAAPGSGSLWFDQAGFFAGQMPGGSNGTPSNPPAEPPVTPPSNYNAGMAANGGFEGGTQPWDGLGVDGTLDTGVFLEGSNSAKVTAASSERSIEESVEVYSGVFYKLSVFVRTAGATSVARIDWLDLSGRVLGSTELPVVAGDTSWKEISASAYSLPNARRARIVLGTAPGSGSAWFDMVSFTK
jgi:hypothetical protein